MTKRRRWWIVGALLLAALAVGVWMYARRQAWLDRVAGAYTATAFDGKGMVAIRFDRDGSALREIYPPGATRPTVAAAGRWRLSGKILIWEEGAAATASVGLGQTFGERFEDPLLGNEVSRFRLVEADEAGLVLDLGGVNWVWQRKPEGR